MLIDDIRRVIELQAEFNSENTSAMRERGVLIRDRIPEELSLSVLDEWTSPVDDLNFEGRDGTGRKTLIPWVRFFSRLQSPSAQNGWYGVLLFHPAEPGFFLAFAHGSTSFDGAQYVQRDPAVISQLVSWARWVTRDDFVGRTDFSEGMSFGPTTSKMAKPYEASTVTAKWYPAHRLDEIELRDDVRFMIGMLSHVYAAETAGVVPSNATDELEEIVKATSSTGQGFSTDPQLRKAVETYAMRIATDFLRSEKFLVTDVSSNSSYDLRAEKSGKSVHVEVKGTTGGLGAIFLTANEVLLHQKFCPQTRLIVVHSITCDIANSYACSGGEIHDLFPFEIDENRLSPLAFRYVI